MPFQCEKCGSYLEQIHYCLVHGKMCPFCGASEDQIKVVLEIPEINNE